MRFPAAWPAVLFALLATGASAQAPLTPQAIQAQLHGPFLMLRGMFGGSRLDFNRKGDLSDLAGVLPFSISALRIDKVRIDRGKIDIQATREALQFHPASQPGQPLAVTPVPWPSGAQLLITLRDDHRHPERTTKALHQIFSSGFDNQLASTAPQAWQPWLHDYLHPKEKTAFTEDEALPNCRAPGIVPPRLLRSTQPSYSTIAQGADYGGTVVLNLTIDRSGQVQDIAIRRPLGMGFDEMAIEAARRFVYTPAIRNKKPEACRADVDFTFQPSGS